MQYEWAWCNDATAISGALVPRKAEKNLGTVTRGVTALHFAAQNGALAFQWFMCRLSESVCLDKVLSISSVWHLDNKLTTHLQYIDDIDRISKAFGSFAWSLWVFNSLAALAWFSAEGSLELVRVLLDHCVDTDKVSKDNGATALHIAAYKGPEISQRIPIVIQPQCIWWDDIIHNYSGLFAST